MSLDFDSLILQCDSILRSGKVGEAARLLRNITLSKVPRASRLPLAKLCRRCDLASLGLKLLTQVVYPEKNSFEAPATGAEWAEFAALRMKIGSVDEALTILNSIDGRVVIEAPLLRAFCYMAKWDYASAALELKEYLSLNPESYPALVARVNLAACLISIQHFEEVFELLSVLIEETKSSGYDRLLANCYELRSQFYLENKNDLLCEKDLSAASEILTFQKTADQLYIKKWRAVLEARRTGAVEGLKILKQEAIQRKSWETVREMDFQSLKIAFDEKTFQHLIWGTPFSAYRERVCRELGQTCVASFFDQFTYQPSPSVMSQLIVDLRTAQVSENRSLNAGKKTHRLLGILLQDFYRPISVGALYADLFPGEYYNVFSSPDRVHQTLRRARRWLEANHLPVLIEELGGQFALRATGPVTFILGSRPKEIDHNSALFERLKRALRSTSTFSSSQVCEITGLSPASAVRFLNWAINAQRIQKQGSGRATRYFLDNGSMNDFMNSTSKRVA